MGVNHSFLGLALLCALPSEAALAGDGKVAIRYALTLAGLPVGSAAININVTDGGPYKIIASAKIGGVLSLVSDGKGSATAVGKLGANQPMSTGYALNSVSADKQQTVRMAISSGTVTESEINPELTLRPDRIPVTDADKRGVIDPVSALVIPVGGKGDILDHSTCERTLPIFDGAQRFDIKLHYSRVEKVKVKGGYAGPALVCAARYVPIAGHRPAREQTKFMAANTDIELWLAPISGTRVLAPWHIVIGTQVGRLVVDATRFAQEGNGNELAATAN